MLLWGTSHMFFYLCAYKRRSDAPFHTGVHMLRCLVGVHILVDCMNWAANSIMCRQLNTCIYQLCLYSYTYIYTWQASHWPDSMITKLIKCQINLKYALLYSGSQQCAHSPNRPGLVSNPPSPLITTINIWSQSLAMGKSTKLLAIPSFYPTITAAHHLLPLCLKPKPGKAQWFPSHRHF